MEKNGNGSDSWISWRKYVQEAISDFKDLKELVTQLRIDLAVLTTKIALFAAGAALIVTILANLFFIWLKGKL